MNHYFDQTCLTIAGSDSGGGAGIQADLHTFAAFGCFATTAITAVTAQNTCGVHRVHVLPVDMVTAQVKAVLDDFPVAAIKLGMLADRATVEAVAELLADARCPIVLDPVMVASTGAQLLSDDAVGALRDQLLPLADVLTPNLDEAALLLGKEGIDGAEAAEAAGRELLELGAKSVLMKGGHLTDAMVIDQLVTPGSCKQWRHARLALDGHGTGCTLAAAVAAGLAQGLALNAACDHAIGFVNGALKHGRTIGHGTPTVLHHAWRSGGASK